MNEQKYVLAVLCLILGLSQMGNLSGIESDNDHVQDDFFDVSSNVLDLMDDQKLSSQETSTGFLSSMVDSIVEAMAAKANNFIEQARHKLLEQQGDCVSDPEVLNSLTRLIAVHATDAFHDALDSINSAELRKLKETLNGMHEVKLIKKLSSGKSEHQVMEHIYSFFQAFRALMPEIQDRITNVPGGTLASFLECLAEGSLPVLAAKTGNRHAIKWVDKLVTSSCYSVMQDGAVAMLPILSALSGEGLAEGAVELLRELGEDQETIA